MNKPFFILTVMASMLLLLSQTSCSPEIVLAQSLEGDWDVESFTVDGEETIGFLITSFTLEFEEYDGEEGDFEFVLIGENGASTTTKGEYAINSDGTELDLDYDDGSREEWDISLEGDDLELSGNFDGERIELKAERD
ncbi:MAG: lipocalin family protein [Bacteroidota bacterium]